MTTFLFFDTETTDRLPHNADVSDPSMPYIVQLAWIKTDDKKNILATESYILKPEGVAISQPGALAVHGITEERAEKEGCPRAEVINKFKQHLDADYLICHNVEFDLHVMAAEFMRHFNNVDILYKQTLCTMKKSTDFCKLPGRFGYKWPKLEELYYVLFNEKPEIAHDALYDVKATERCFWELVRLGVIGY